jgi:hypothetical protein
MDLFDIVSTLEENEDLHLGRLLILLWVFGGSRRETVKGLTKLAKLDFLLRYPVYLERALAAKGKSAEVPRVNLTEDERKSVESLMVRYRYGPWDFRYRRFLNLLVAKGLAAIEIEGRSINVGLTESGAELGAQLASAKEFEDIVSRAKLLKKNVNMKATALKDFIYQTFPEISSMRLGEEIVK